MITNNGKVYETTVAKRLKCLIRANHSLANIESLDELMPKLLSLARNVSCAEASSLLLYNPEHRILEFGAVEDETLGDKADEILKSSVKLKLGEGIAGWVAAKRKSAIVQDAHSDPRFFKGANHKTGLTTRTLLSVPLIHHEELLGVINVLNSKGKSCFDSEDQELLESFADLAAVAIMRSKLLELKIKQQRLQVQLETASRIQSLFWPKLPLIGAGSHVWAVSVPASFVGGDVYDVIPMPDGSWLIYVADVSDKGLPAALLMAALWTKIRSESMLQEEVDRLLETANDAMYDLMAEEGFFVSIALGKYWPATGRLQFTLGGHFPPLWIVGDGLKNPPKLRGISLGVTLGAEYEKKEIVLSPGESVIFMTDGVTEAPNEQLELFGHHRFADYIKKAKGPPWGNLLLDAVIAWQGFTEASDDLTMVEIWRDPI